MKTVEIDRELALGVMIRAKKKNVVESSKIKKKEKN